MKTFVRRVKVWGERPRHLLDQAAARYIQPPGFRSAIESLKLVSPRQFWEALHADRR